MKTLSKLCALLFAGALLIAGCSSRDAFKITSITMAELSEKMQDDESFLLLVERDNCPFCEALNEYIDQTKAEHPGIEVYEINTSSMEMKKPTEQSRTLVSDSEAGKKFLRMFPYFYYTPTIYRIEDGEPVEAGIGYDSSTHSIALWDVDSSADLETARQQDVWKYLSGE